MELLIRNAVVYDPINGIDGERMDILVRDGKIVDSINEMQAKVIDASGMIAMPGGVDIHSHIAGPKVNKGRELRPEDHLRYAERGGRVRRSGVGYSIPTTFMTGYWYARMGYTTVMEPATAPLETRHTHEELNDTPILDKACFPLVGSNWFIMEYLRRGDLEKCATYVAWLLRAVKGYAMKLVAPGSVETWGWGRGLMGIDEVIPHFEITPRDIIRGLCRANNLLNLPSPIHIHCNALGAPGNFRVTLETMRCVEDLSRGDRPSIHIVHIQFNAYAGSDWASLSSGATRLARYVNRHSHVTADLGQVIFTDTTTMTADGPWQYRLHNLSGNKWINHDVEAETGGGIVPYHYRRRNYVNAIQWTIGLEFALQVKDPWKICLTTDHPNGGPFIEYPRVMAWLLSRRARLASMRRLNKTARRRSILESLEREYSLYELAIVTRASPARILGLREKGHLGIGADADISLYRIDPSEVDPSRDFRAVRRSLRRAAYTIKEGEIVVKEGEVVGVTEGRTFWVEAEVPEGVSKEVLSDLKERFEDYYTIRLENYPIEEGYLRRPSVRRTRPEAWVV
ncbi:formylmethanofuran dehydrogenase subunit A [Candidatus Bathyarchaeota archaeon]|nr:MAG: formylmethanofuran dehydrogenase subunit A [Candidatus Bathyarchaeota archaeon]